MKQSERVSRTPSGLSESINQHLNMYALAATAAGVGFLALSQPAEAKIVYTPASVTIVPNNTITLDLNHDGVADFSFKDTSFRTSFGGGGGFLSVVPAQKADEVW